MRSRKNGRIIGLSIFCVAVGCVEQPKPPGPCSNVPFSTAEFVTKPDTIKITNYQGRSTTPKDWDPFILPLAPNQTHFLAYEAVNLVPKMQDADSYEWTIPKAGRTETVKNLFREFQIKETTENWEIRLKIKKSKTIYTCFADDDSVKTFIKTITIHKKPIWYGSWRGVDIDLPLDTFIVNFTPVAQWDYVNATATNDLFKHYTNWRDTLLYRASEGYYNFSMRENDRYVWYPETFPYKSLD